ncbi:hypothetical protein T439DRAFT_323025 [Meredithblackwellia eburnea MCA 4105]
MAEEEMNNQAQALAKQLLQAGHLIRQVESNAAMFQQLDPSIWSRIKAQVEAQSFQALLETTNGDHRQTSDAAGEWSEWSGTMNRWILPQLNARCPPPVVSVTVDSAQMIDDSTGADLNLNNTSNNNNNNNNNNFFPAIPHSSAAPSPIPTFAPSIQPGGQQQLPGSPLFGIEDSSFITPEVTVSAPPPPPQVVYQQQQQDTFFPSSTLPPTTQPYFAPVIPPPPPSSGINPRLLINTNLDNNNNNSSAPPLPIITTTMFAPAPFPNGDLLMTTAHQAWNDAGTPTKLFGGQPMFDTFMPDYSSLSLSSIGVSGPFSQSLGPLAIKQEEEVVIDYDLDNLTSQENPFALPPSSSSSPAPGTGTGTGTGGILTAASSRPASPIPPSLTIDRSDTPPVPDMNGHGGGAGEGGMIIHQPEPQRGGVRYGHGRSRSFGSSAGHHYHHQSNGTGGRSHRHSISSGSRVEPYPTSATDVSDDELLPSGGAGAGAGGLSRPHTPNHHRHRRGSSASRIPHNRSPDGSSSRELPLPSGGGGGGSSQSSVSGDSSTTNRPAPPVSLSARQRKTVSGSSSSHRRSPSAGSHSEFGPGPGPAGGFATEMGFVGGAQSTEPSPATGLEQLHLSPNLDPLFAPLRRSQSDTNVAGQGGQGSGGGGGGRITGGAGAGAKTRNKRILNYAKDAVFKENDTTIFVIYAPTKADKAQVTTQDVHEVVLDHEANKRDSTLWKVAFEGLEFTRQLLALDVQRGESYIFRAKVPPKKSSSSAASSQATKYHVHFSAENPGGLVSIVDSDDMGLHQPKLAMTFVHFRPNSIIVLPAQPIGSANWWRLPRCVGRHLKPDEPDGSWTGRWDTDDPRRPSRIVEHFADCDLRKHLEDWDSLGKLARAIRAPLAGIVKTRARRKSNSGGGGGVKESSLGVGGGSGMDDDDDDEDDGDDEDAIDSYRSAIDEYRWSNGVYLSPRG